MRVVGVDGTLGGYVVASLDLARSGARFASGRVSLSRAATFDDVMRAANDAVQVCVDMPIGLLDERPARRADLSARAALGRARSRVFPVPPRPVVDEADYPRALARSRALTGSGISKQIFHLFPKIREVDAFVADARVHEGHPELAFAALQGGVPVFASKKSWNGVMHRLRLLGEAQLTIPDDEAALDGVPTDDVLDAVVMAVSAARIARGEDVRYGDEETREHDRSGRVIVIRA